MANSSLAATTDADGVFEVDGIMPGQHFLQLQPTPGLTPLDLNVDFTIEADQTRELTIDLRPLEVSLRHLRITERGTPLAAHRVFLHVKGTPLPASPKAWQEHLFGFTDHQGHVAGEFPASGLASFWIQSMADDAPKQHPTAIVPLTCKPLPPIEVAY